MQWEQPELPHILLAKAAQLKPKQCMATKIFDAVQEFEHKYGEKVAAWAIVAIVVYLVIAQ
jgi:hypothetical protein